MPGIYTANQGTTYPGGDKRNKESLSGWGDQGSRKGVFARHPAMTPKYHTGNTDSSLGYMARMLIPLSAKAHQQFINSVPAGTARDLAKALAVIEGEGGLEWNGVSFGYIDFLLQGVQEAYQEKFEAVDVLSDNYVSYFYGQQPPIFQYSGTLLNTYQDDWSSAFTILYQEVLRGTKMARHKTVVNLAYNDVIVTGVLLSMSQSLTADMEMAIPFTFQVLVKRYDTHARSGAPLCPPTPLTEYPYRITPSAFASPIIDPTAVSEYTAQVPIFSITPRQASPEPTPPSKIAYVGNVVTPGEAMYEKAIADKYAFEPNKFPEPPTETKQLSPNTVQEATSATYQEKVKAEVSFYFPKE